MHYKLLLERKQAADKAWNEIIEKMNVGEKIDRETIGNAMQRCNDVDQKILDYNNSFASFMKTREQTLTDCDLSSDDEEQDKIHQKLREQFQEIYGKDIKHG